MKSILFLTLTLCSLLSVMGIIGCATAPATFTAPAPPPGMPGFYHRVAKGHTLWRISKMYDMELQELVKANGIADASIIKEGQLIFVPNRSAGDFRAPAEETEDFTWPIKGRVVSHFGQNYNDMINNGINIQPFGKEEVVAARRGKVVFLHNDFASYGTVIIIEHRDRLYTVYSGPLEVSVALGQYVEKGVLISRIKESTGQANKYLHFEVRKGPRAHNPYFYLSPQNG